MGEKLFVGGLSFDTSEESLRAAFSAHGTVEEAIIINDRDTGRPRGFGFVTMDSPASAEAAIAALDGSELDGRQIRVNVAEQKSRGGGGGRGRGDGGRGGGRGGRGGDRRGGRSRW